MFLTRQGDCALIVFAVVVSTSMFFFSLIATAADISSSIGVDVRHTDNAKLTPDNEINELIVNTSVGAKIDYGSGPFRFNADTSLIYQQYTQETFGDQQYFNLNATAGWAMFKNRLDWKLQDFFSQRSINSLDPATPDNVQDTNVLTFGPKISFPISARQSFTLQPEYRKFTYEAQDIDNQQNSLDANWKYQMFRTLSVGLRGGINNVDYEQESISDSEFRSIYLTISGKRPRSTYGLNLGSTHVDRGSSGSTRGLTGNLSWMFNLTGSSSAHAYVSSEITDANSGLLNASRNPEYGDFSNEQISTEIMRNKAVRFTYKRADTELKSSIWSELREQDYELLLLDRDAQVIGAKFEYPATATVSIGVYMESNRTELIDVGRKDSQNAIGGNINYSLSGKLRSTIDLKYTDKDSTIDSEDFSEMSIFVSLVYGNRQGGSR